MRFDARAAAKLPSGGHMTFEEFPGLRLQASASRKSWTYRYKSPVDGRMRQVKLGEWPTMAFAAAISAWEKGRAERDSGAELSAPRRKREEAAARPSPTSYTVRELCRDYLEGHVEPNRKTKGAVEVARMFKAMLGPIADVSAATVTRAQGREGRRDRCHGEFRGDGGGGRSLVDYPETQDQGAAKRESNGSACATHRSC